MSDKPGKNPDTWPADESTVSRAYGELKQAGPPAHLDEQILAEARRVAASQDHTVIRVQRWRKWTLPAALAATVVFAVPLVVNVVQNAPPDIGSDPRVAERRTEKIDLELVESEERLAELTGRTPVASSADRISPQAIVAVPPKPEPAPVSPYRQVDGVSEEEQRRQAETLLREAAQADSASIAKDLSSLDEIYAGAPPSQETGKPLASLRDDASEAGFTDETETAADLAAVSVQQLNQETSAAAARKERRRDGVAMSSVAEDERGLTVANADQALDTRVEQVIAGRNNPLEPEQWLIDIADDYHQGRVSTARLRLGSFFTVYPDYELPEDYPLRAEDAVYDRGGSDEIVPEAASWLRGIGMLAERGEIDQARTQLADFFKLFPDYALPPDFPLTREDALPIDR